MTPDYLLIYFVLNTQQSKSNKSIQFGVKKGLFFLRMYYIDKKTLNKYQFINIYL